MGDGAFRPFPGFGSSSYDAGAGRGAGMRRRDFIALGSAFAAFGAARATAEQLPIIGFLRSSTRGDSIKFAASFREGLKSAGFIDGQNVLIEERYADNQLDRPATLVTELIRKPVALIVANSAAVNAAKDATKSVPVAFVTGSDPVRDGLVASLNKPGGNITGVVFITGALGTKRLELLRQAVPKAGTIGVLVYPGTPETEEERKDIEQAAQSTGQKLVAFDARNEQEIEAALTSAAERKIGAIIVGSGPFLFSKREFVVAAVARHAIPAIYATRESAELGGLMSYGTSITEAYRQAANYSARILNGEKPADLPVMQSSKFEFILNLKTAKALSVSVFHRRCSPLPTR